MDAQVSAGQSATLVSVKLVYLARLREALGVAAEDAALPAGTRDVAGVVRWLSARGGAWATELAAGRAFRVAVNQQMATPATAVRDGDEIAIFPPVTGG